MSEHVSFEPEFVVVHAALAACSRFGCLGGRFERRGHCWPSDTALARLALHFILGSTQARSAPLRIVPIGP